MDIVIVPTAADVATYAADVVAGRMPPEVAEMIELDSAWRSFGVAADRD